MTKKKKSKRHSQVYMNVQHTRDVVNKTSERGKRFEFGLKVVGGKHRIREVLYANRFFCADSVFKR